MRGRPWLDRAEAMRRDEGASLREIAAAVGITPEGVRKGLLTRGLSGRSPQVQALRRREAASRPRERLRAVLDTLTPLSMDRAAWALGLSVSVLKGLVPEAGAMVVEERGRRQDARMRPWWAMRQGGATWGEVGRASGYSEHAVHQLVKYWAKGRGLPVRQVGVRRDPGRAARALELREGEGLSWAELARRAGYGSVESAKNAVGRARRARRMAAAQRV